MKTFLVLFLVIIISGTLVAQKELLVEKIGTNKKYYFKIGNDIKIKVKPFDTIVRGKIWDIQDKSVSITELKMNDVMIKDIGVVYKKYAFPRKFAIRTAQFSAAIFLIIIALTSTTSSCRINSYLIFFNWTGIR